MGLSSSQGHHILTQQLSVSEVTNIKHPDGLWPAGVPLGAGLPSPTRNPCLLRLLPRPQRCFRPFHSPPRWLQVPPREGVLAALHLFQLAFSSPHPCSGMQETTTSDSPAFVATFGNIPRQFTRYISVSGRFLAFLTSSPSSANPRSTLPDPRPDPRNPTPPSYNPNTPRKFRPPQF